MIFYMSAAMLLLQTISQKLRLLLSDLDHGFSEGLLGPGESFT